MRLFIHKLSQSMSGWKIIGSFSLLLGLEKMEDVDIDALECLTNEEIYQYWNLPCTRWEDTIPFYMS